MLFFQKRHRVEIVANSFPGSGTFAHGVHPPEFKALAADAPIEIVPTPDKVILPLLQNIGAPCTPLVKNKQTVAFGQIVGKGESFISASLHAPVAGVVQSTAMTTLANGRHMQAVVIKSEGDQLEGQALWDTLYGGQWPQKAYQAMDPQSISAAINNAGIVGLGGAAFPTHVKIMPSDKKPIHTLVVNGCECEPYLTNDYRLMVEAPEAIVAGALLSARAVGALSAYIGIENNKPEAAAALRRAAAGAGIKIAVLKTKYPQGSEKHLIKAILNKEVPLGGFPSDIGVAMTTRGMMRDVLIALLPVVIASVYFFRWFAVKQLLICVVSCILSEALFTHLRSRPQSLNDMSAAVTGTILGLSLAGTAPWYVGVIGTAVAMGIGKMVFGGLGMNIFNPAMVGRAFVMIAFAGDLAAAGYVRLGSSSVDIISQATPLSAFKQAGVATSATMLFLGNTNGSLGETSALACLLGGIYLCYRRSASWEIPAGILAGTLLLAGLANLTDLAGPWTVLHHLLGGSLLFGAFFIATDPVTSPLTPQGKWIYGLGIGAITIILRLYSGYPEGVMFAVLLLNALTPLINRWRIPRPFGGV